MDWNHVLTIVGWVIGLTASLVAVILWFSRRDMDRYEKGLSEIAELRVDVTELKSTMITRDDLDTFMERLDSTRRDMHVENRGILDRIEHKIDQSEERNSKTRHDIRDELHVVKLKMALIERELGVNYKG